jgi:prominin 1
MNAFALNPGIGSVLGGRIKDQLKPKVTPVLEEIKAMATGKHGGKGDQE